MTVSSHVNAPLMVAGVKLVRPLPPEYADGLYWFDHIVSGKPYGVKSAEVAAAIEFIYGLEYQPMQIRRKLARDRVILCGFVAENEPEAFSALID